MLMALDNRRSYANTANYTNSVFARVAGSTLSLRTFLSFR